MVYFLHAAHWSYLVGSKWGCRGGIFLVAHPGALKSQTIETLQIHERALILGDANVPSITRLRDDVALGRYRTLGFTEFEKLYQRNQTTAMNVEGHIRAFVDEGFRHPVWEDSRMTGRKAFCMVIGAMTPLCYSQHYTKWLDSGFGRRFLWINYCLSDPGILTEAIHRWQKIKFPGLTVLQVEEEEIPYNLTETESKELQKMLDVDANTSFVLLKKIAVILKHAKGNEFMDIIRDVAPCFKGEGGELIVERKFESHGNAEIPYRSQKVRRKVQRGPMRRDNRRSSKGADSPKIRVHGLEAERELPGVPSGSSRDREGKSEEGSEKLGAAGGA
jgi:hypothetical protein